MSSERLGNVGEYLYFGFQRLWRCPTCPTDSESGRTATGPEIQSSALLSYLYLSFLACKKKLKGTRARPRRVVCARYAHVCA